MVFFIFIFYYLYYYLRGQGRIQPPARTALQTPAMHDTNTQRRSHTRARSFCPFLFLFPFFFFIAHYVRCLASLYNYQHRARHTARTHTHTHTLTCEGDRAAASGRFTAASIRPGSAREGTARAGFKRGCCTRFETIPSLRGED